MDNVSDICMNRYQCFMTLIQIKVISGYQVKKVKQKIGI